jgi:hypothetical protein
MGEWKVMVVIHTPHCLHTLLHEHGAGAHEQAAGFSYSGRVSLNERVANAVNASSTYLASKSIR